MDHAAKIAELRHRLAVAKKEHDKALLEGHRRMETLDEAAYIVEYPEFKTLMKLQDEQIKSYERKLERALKSKK